MVGNWGLYSPAEPPGTQPSPPMGDPPPSPTTMGTRAGLMEHLPSALSTCLWCPLGPEEQEQSPKLPTPSRWLKGSFVPGLGTQPQLHSMHQHQHQFFRDPKPAWWSHLLAKGTTQ